jgi:hypothetical protein
MMSRKKSTAGNDADYSVGYRKPPSHSRFKPGISGNPKGRPRGRKNSLSIFFEVMQEKVPLREGGQLKKVSKFEAMIRLLWQRALNGDPKAIAIIFDLSKELKNHEPVPGHEIIVTFVKPDGTEETLE